MSYNPIQTEQHATNLHGGPFQPLDWVMMMDTFEEGMDGWKQLDATQGHVSRGSLVDKYQGAHGAVTGQYALRLRTTGSGGDFMTALKRPTMPWFGADATGDAPYPEKLRYETVFTYHAEPFFGDERHIQRVRFMLDAQTDTDRFHPKLSYDLYDGANDVWWEKWSVADGQASGASWINPDNNSQELAYNEPWPPGESEPWRPSWHYVRLDVDMANNQYIEMQCNNKVIDLSGISTTTDDPRENLQGIVNPMVMIKTNGDSGNEGDVLLYIDSACMSVEGVN